MSETRSTVRMPVEHPERAVRGEFVEPILFLASRMAGQDPLRPPPAKPMVERLAERIGLRGFQEQSAYRRLTEAGACDALGTERARKGALVVAALVLKTDTTGGEAAKAAFTRLRERLGLEPIAVPASVEEHLTLALQYLRD